MDKSNKTMPIGLLEENDIEHELDSSPYTGMLKVKPVNELMAEMAETPDPEPLFDCLWQEGEVACLFADSNVGKSIFDVQMAESIAVKRSVMYVDCELTDKQFQQRYSNPDSGVYHAFPAAFYRATIAPERIGAGNLEDCLLQDIEAAALKNHCRIIIIDNLTFVCNTSEKGDTAGAFMMKLKRLQMRYGWSILIIAHTPKRDDGCVITINHLAGSRKLFNFFDSVFALGKSRQDDNYRYLKQLKVRSGEFVFTEENVAVFELEKCDDGSLHFIHRKYDSENSQLNSFSEDDIELSREIVKLHDSGMKYREIANKLGISKSRAQRIYLKFRHKEIPIDELVPPAFEFEKEASDETESEELF